jgi:tetratricopeptide (TPR) repeat protein
MNYGLTQMSKGDFKAALASFQTALALTPNYSLLHINTAIVEGALGRDAEATQHFNQALSLAPGDSKSYYYFARWLSEHRENAPAIALLETGVQKNSADMACRVLLLDLYARERAFDKLEPLLADSLRIAPDDPDLLRFRTQRATAQPPPTRPPQTAEDLLQLSLTYYQANRYEECISAAQQALRLNPNYAEAYNNIAAGYNAMGHYEEGIRAASKAVRLKPDFALARNNLAWAESQLARQRQQKPTAVH